MKTCEVCGRELHGRQRLYCSMKCRRKAKAERKKDPSKAKPRYKYWVLRSPSGDLYRTYSLRDFVEAHPEDFRNAEAAIHGFGLGCVENGWTVVSRQTTDGELVASPPRKNRTFWTLRSPSGEVYGFSNLRQFLREHPEDFPNVDSAASAFTHVSGTDRTVRGWSVLPNPETSAKVSTWSPARLYKLMTCRDCGREYTGHIRTIRCPECQKEVTRRNNVEYLRRKRAGQVREIGSTAICEACGKKYTVDAPRQRYCKECAPTAIRENCNKKSSERKKIAYADPVKRAIRNERSRHAPLPHTCAVCGREFYDIGNPLYCSEECRYADLTPEQKEQRNAQARDRRAKQKALLQQQKNAGE